MTGFQLGPAHESNVATKNSYHHKTEGDASLTSNRKALVSFLNLRQLGGAASNSYNNHPKQRGRLTELITLIKALFQK